MESYNNLCLGVDDHAVTHPPEKGIAEFLIEWIKRVYLFNEAGNRGAAHIQITEFLLKLINLISFLLAICRYP